MDANVPAPWAHQTRALEFSQKHPNVALFYDIGTGKSRTAIDMYRHRCAAHGRLLRCLILCPKIVVTNWKREFQRYSKIHSWDVIPLIGEGKKRKALFEIEATDSKTGTLTNNKIFITNYETMQMKELHSLIQKWQPEVVIADEVHYIKNPESKRGKSLLQISEGAQYRYALTGTPILKNGMDIFMTYKFLDGGKTFGSNFWQFRNTWFEDANARWQGDPQYYPKWEPRPESYKEFNRRISLTALQARKSECLDLPPFVRKEVFVELSKEQARLYKEMKDEYIAFIDAHEKSGEPKAVVAQLAVTKALRLQQIATGFAKDEDGEIHTLKENPRADALKELLRDLHEDHKIIVWSVFHENYATIAKVCDELGLVYRELHGKIPQKDRDKNIDAFNNDVGVRVLIANQAAGGIGINLVSSDVSIFYSKGFSLGQDLQAEGRNYRGGSERHTSVTRIDIIAQNTIDDLISQSLALKQDTANQILNWRDKL